MKRGKPGTKARSAHRARSDWSLFLEGLVGKGRPVSVAALDLKLAELTKRDGDARNEIYAYIRGTQTPRRDRAYWVGEALRQLGVGWSNGAVALYVAGHVGEFVRLLAKLAPRELQFTVMLAILVPMVEYQTEYNLDVYGYREAARVLLDDITDSVAAFISETFKGSERGSYDVLLTFASGADHLGNHAKPVIRAALVEWALDVADPDLARLLVKDIANFEAERWRQRAFYSEAIADFRSGFIPSISSKNLIAHVMRSNRRT